MKYELAAHHAVRICQILAPYCTRINIAGSIRRKKREVKDIEIVCVPQCVSAGTLNLFETTLQEVKVHPAFVSHVRALGKALKGSPAGRYMQIQLPEYINLDLFMPQPHDYFRQYAIRTGPADYSARVIAAAWVRNGWVGTPDGLRLRDECRQVAEHKWEAVTALCTEPPVWGDEQEFFTWLGLEWVLPENRF